MSDYRLRLYVNGQSRAGERALANLKQICDAHLAGRYVLEVVDLVAAPEQAEADAVLATPTLILLAPEPRRRVVGDLSDQRLVLQGLGLTAG